MEVPHAELSLLKQVYHEIINFVPPSIVAPPILDSSVDFAEDGKDLFHRDHVPGLRHLRESVKRDLDVLQEFLDDPNSVNLPPLSTNAPYLVGVWNEILLAPQPVVALFKTYSLKPQKVQQQYGNGHRPRQEQGVKQSTVKVDIVAENGKQWIRINTVKNNRILAEFREIDSYDTDSSDGETDRPSLAQKEFDNSVLRMGRDLLAASRLNPLVSGGYPQIILRLTRLDPKDPKGDPRIAQTIEMLEDMGISVKLGERTKEDIPTPIRRRSPTLPIPVEPTQRINLDLSILIALVSDLSHAALPTSTEAAEKRFIPPLKYMEWKKARAEGKRTPTDQEADIDAAIEIDVGTHSKALTNQCFQEMGNGMIQEIHNRISSLPSVEFWTTIEAKERCVRIVSKIGGENEKRRVRGLFPNDCAGLLENLSEGEEAEELLWRGSRYPRGFISFLPIHIYHGDFHADLNNHPLRTEQTHPFFRVLSNTCGALLSQEEVPHPRVAHRGSRLERAAVMKANPKLTAHTVQSLSLGAVLGWTTLTANKTSIKVILREIATNHLLDFQEKEDHGEDGCNGWSKDGVCSAAIWITDPRSLAEGMRSDLDS